MELKDEEEKPSKTLPGECLETAVEWCETTSFHGFPNIARSVNVYFGIAWTLCLCTFAGYCAYSLYQSIAVYLEFGVITEIQSVYENPTTFPLITICNVNPFTTNEGLNYVNQTLFNNQVTNVLDPTLLVNIMKYDYQTVINTLFFKEMVLSNSKNEANENKTKFGYPLNSLVIMCFYNLNACNDTDFSWYYSSEYGNCFQFNNKNLADTLMTMKPGVRHGLTVGLFTGLIKSPYSLSFSTGGHIFINNQTSSPTSSNGLDVSPGVFTDIQIAKTFSNKQPWPYNDCYDDLTTPDKFDSFFYRETLKSGYAYRQVDCLNLVEQDYYIKNCSCADATYPTLYGAKFCETIDENSCIYSAYLRIYSTGLNLDWIKLCPLECDTQDFSFTTSWTKFPSESLADIFLAHSKIQYGLDYINKSNTTKSLRDSLAYVNIFYDYTGYTMITETPSQGPIDLLGSIGGTMGLYLGVSFLSFVEVVELMIKLGILVFRRLKLPRYKIQDQPEEPIEENDEHRFINLKIDSQHGIKAMVMLFRRD